MQFSLDEDRFTRFVNFSTNRYIQYIHAHILSWNRRTKRRRLLYLDSFRERKHQDFIRRHVSREDIARKINLKKKEERKKGKGKHYANLIRIARITLSHRGTRRPFLSSSFL